MSDQMTAAPPGALRAVAMVAAGVGVVALVAGAFVFSYPGLHAVALQARVSPRLARGYPLMFDALLVVAMPAALFLRSAGWGSRLLAWIVLLALLCAAAGADALHAAGGRLDARPAAITAAILPWALVLIAFVLLLAMLQHARARRLAAERASVSVSGPEPTEPLVYAPLRPQPLVPGFPARAVPGPAEPVITETDADADDLPAEPSTTDDALYPAGPAAEAVARQDSDAPDDLPADDDPEMPVFHRAWSAPVPPGDAAQ
jgi:hypothetical protein